MSENTQLELWPQEGETLWVSQSKVELIRIDDDPEAHIGEQAAECYDSKTDRESCIRRAGHCVDSGHLATLRFASASFRISGISRTCSHQLVRVAHAGILQKSQRYVKESAITYIDPPELLKMPPEIREEWLELQKRAEHLYLTLTEQKLMKKEDARYILPQGCETSLRIIMNFQGWKDFLGNRTSNHAQWEIRHVAKSIQSILREHAPHIF